MAEIWRPVCKRAELEGFHFHWLRHGYASLMVGWGILGTHPHYVSEQMGHFTPTITRDTYGHLMKGGVRLDREATLQTLWAAYQGTEPPAPAADERAVAMEAVR